MLKVAVVGVGNMGKHHVRNYSEIKSVRLVGVCDANIKLGKEIAKSFKTKFYREVGELVQKESPDAVSLAVPTHLHKTLALKLLDQNINILIEKPIAQNVPDAEEIYKKAKAKKLVVCVGHIERFNPAVLRLKELVEDKKLGEILSIVVKRVGLFPPQVSDVNVVTDIGVHDLDIVTNLLGKVPKSIYATGSGALTKGREDHSEIFLDYEKFGCFIQTNWVTPIKIRNLSITGTKAHAELNYITQQLKLYKSNYSITPYKGFKKYKEFVVRFGEPEKVNLHIRKKEPLRLEIENFLDCIVNNKAPKVTVSDAILALKLADTVNKSIKTHKLMNFDK